MPRSRFRLCAWDGSRALLVAVLLASAPAAAEEIAVDLELVLAVDVSYSVDWNEGYLQREGYIRAFEDPRLVAAITGGIHGRIAVTYVEWAGRGVTRTVADWTLIDGVAAAEAFATALISQPVNGGRGTSISGILALATDLFDANGYDGVRRVIDVSGDGANNVGGNVAVHRDMVVRNGITINGLPILDRERGLAVGQPGEAVHGEQVADPRRHVEREDVAREPQPAPDVEHERPVQRQVPVRPEVEGARQPGDPDAGADTSADAAGAVSRQLGPGLQCGGRLRREQRYDPRGNGVSHRSYATRPP